MAFIADINHDEIRNGFLIKAGRKKVWERQLEIWQEVDRICRKHAIAYWAAYGTLLGAARHGGFIPWYDKLDLCMMRPEFNRFSKVMEKEFRQSGGLCEVRLSNFSRLVISHSQTTLLMPSDLINKQGVKGLIIDIFPLDAALDDTAKGLFAANGINELFATVYDYSAVEKYLAEGVTPANELRVIKALHELSDKDKQLEFLNQYAEGLFSWSKAVHWVIHFAQESQLKEWYRKTIYLPFESVQMPVPVDYDKVLTNVYGDWHEFIYDKKSRLGVRHSADIPYKEFMELINVDMLIKNLDKDDLKDKNSLTEEANVECLS